MGKITVYENGKRRGSTSQAFNVTVKKELMREHTLNFSILNNNPIYQEITTLSVFENKGQLFDITNIDTDSGKENISSVSAEHVSYRTNNYIIPTNYAFVGTVKEIAQDILKISGADAEFSVGECCDLGTVSFSMNNEKEITVRATLFGMAALGVEVDYDNFTVNIPQRIGRESGKVFRFGVDLQNFRRRWQKGNGWTYDISIADIQKNPNYTGTTFSLGDDAVAEDLFIGDSIKNRVISYVENEDNPAENSITMGVFIADEENNNVETDCIANTAMYDAEKANEAANKAQETADNSVQQGEKYSNVSITHKDGFVAVNKSGTQRVLMNADDCFVVQTLQNGAWVTVNALEAFGLLVDRLTSMEAKNDFYIKVGKNDDGFYGLDFYIKGKKAFRIGTSSRGDFSLNSSVGFRIGDEGAVVSIEGATLQIGSDSIIVADGGSLHRGITGTFKCMQDSVISHEIEVINGIIVSIG